MRMLAFAAVKGGVGKTTAAVNVAVAAAQSGVPTVLWDLDPQAAACHLLGVEPVSGPPPKSGVFRRRAHHPDVPTAVQGLTVIPADSTLVDGASLADAKQLDRVIESFEDRVGLMVLDLPAGVDSAVTAAVQAGADIVVPIVPSTLSVRSYEQFVAFARPGRNGQGTTSVRVRGFVSMADPTLKRHADFVSALRSEHPEILQTWIPYTVELERACDQRRPVAVAFPRGRAATAFATFWVELAK